jgi:hypothetical protein
MRAPRGTANRRVKAGTPGSPVPPMESVPSMFSPMKSRPPPRRASQRATGSVTCIRSTRFELRLTRVVRAVPARVCPPPPQRRVCGSCLRPACTASASRSSVPRIDAGPGLFVSGAVGRSATRRSSLR